jgi:hypothetical protein
MISPSSSVVSLASLATATTPTPMVQGQCSVDISDYLLPSTTTSKPSSVARLCRILPEDYKLNDNDVFCGRGKSCFKHIGNNRFRHIIIANLPRYRKATTKSAKTSIIFDMVDHIRNICQSTGHGAGFVKRDRSTGLYYEAGDMIAVSTSMKSC